MFITVCNIFAEYILLSISRILAAEKLIEDYRYSHYPVEAVINNTILLSIDLYPDNKRRLRFMKFVESFSELEIFNKDLIENNPEKHKYYNRCTNSVI